MHFDTLTDATVIDVGVMDNYANSFSERVVERCLKPVPSRILSGPVFHLDKNRFVVGAQRHVIGITASRQGSVTRFASPDYGQPAESSLNLWFDFSEPFNGFLRQEFKIHLYSFLHEIEPRHDKLNNFPL